MSEILANCATCGLEINEDTGTPCGGCGDAYCATHFFGPAGQAQANDREFCALCEALDAADSVPTETPAQLLEAAHRAAADLLSEIAESPEIMDTLRRRHSEMAKDVERTHKAWKAAGEAFLRSLHEKGAGK